jgi:hypothetical protein
MNKKGMIGFPMRLAVTFLILALFVPAAFGMVSDMEKSSAASAAKAEAEKIEDTVKRIYYTGAGSTGTVNVSLSSGACLVLGGEGSDSYCITVFIYDKKVDNIYLQRPSVKFLGDPLFLMGDRTVQIECVIMKGVYGVEVRLID